MFINNAWLKQPLWETPNEGGAGGADTTTGGGADTAPGGEDTTTGGSGDLLGDDTTAGASGDDTAPGDSSDLLSGDDTAEGATFGADEVTADGLKELFVDDDGKPLELEWDDEQLTSFLDVVNGAESRADMAKQLLDLYDAQTAQTAEAMATEFKATTDAWQQEVREDRHLGGDKLEATLASVKTFIETHSTDPKATLAAFKATGISNSIHLIQLLHKAAELVPGEASPVEGAPVPTGQSLADRLFGGNTT